ncbi:MAG TPA: ATP-binding protein [Opitutales bacterium]|jgi:two-component system phosphate regulon sensor histidine kinase PhoR|nr:ATP-binding protein [Opitutales bacterium]
MWPILTVVFALIAAFLMGRLWQLRRRLREMADAAETRTPNFLTGDDSLTQRYHLARLQRALDVLADAHAQLTRQERGYFAQIETTFANIKEAVLLVNSAQRVVLANAAAAELLGAEKVMPGARLEVAVRGAGVIEYMYRTLRGESVPRAEFQLPLGRDQTRWVEISGAPLAAPAPDGQKLCLFVLHDITRLKDLENVRKEFVANVSHELRTPLTVIKGFAEALVEDDERLSREDRMRFLDRIMRQTHRLVALVNDLLALSRLESTQHRIELKPQSLRAVVDEVVADYAEKFREAHVAIELDLRHTDDVLPLDALKISQVLQNLFDNCFRYAKGFSRVKVLTRQEDDCVRVTVEDNGCGIPAADVPHIFERFYRVDKGRSRESGGTGLGLSIVKHTVMLHGGEAMCESEERAGTRIHFTLPVPKAEIKK